MAQVVRMVQILPVAEGLFNQLVEPREQLADIRWRLRIASRKLPVGPLNILLGFMPMEYWSRRILDELQMLAQHFYQVLTCQTNRLRIVGCGDQRTLLDKFFVWVSVGGKSIHVFSIRLLRHVATAVCIPPPTNGRRHCGTISKSGFR